MQSGERADALLEFGHLWQILVGLRVGQQLVEPCPDHPRGLVFGQGECQVGVEACLFGLADDESDAGQADVGEDPVTALVG